MITWILSSATQRVGVADPDGLGLLRGPPARSCDRANRQLLFVCVCVLVVWLCSVYIICFRGRQSSAAWTWIINRCSRWALGDTRIRPSGALRDTHATRKPSQAFSIINQDVWLICVKLLIVLLFQFLSQSSIKVHQGRAARRVCLLDVPPEARISPESSFSRALLIPPLARGRWGHALHLSLSLSLSRSIWRQFYDSGLAETASSTDPRIAFPVTTTMMRKRTEAEMAQQINHGHVFV